MKYKTLDFEDYPEDIRNSVLGCLAKQFCYMFGYIKKGDK